MTKKDAFRKIDELFKRESKSQVETSELIKEALADYKEKNGYGDGYIDLSDTKVSIPVICYEFSGIGKCRVTRLMYDQNTFDILFVDIEGTTGEDTRGVSMNSCLWMDTLSMTEAVIRKTYGN